MKDRRYSIQLEYCGYAKPQWVVRYCSDWVGCRPTKDEAINLANEHHKEVMTRRIITM